MLGSLIINTVYSYLRSTEYQPMEFVNASSYLVHSSRYVRIRTPYSVCNK